MFQAKVKEELPHARIRRCKVQSGRGGGGGGGKEPGSKLAEVSVEINTCVHVARAFLVVDLGQSIK